MAFSRRIGSAADGKAGIDQASEFPASDRSGNVVRDRCRLETYWRKATARIRTDATIQITDQNSAGIPVALAMFKASVGTVVAKGVDRKKTFFRSSKAFSTHCTARRLTRKVATRAEANRATANRPADKSTPAINVKGRPLNEAHVPANIGLTTPKIVVSASTTTAEPRSTMRAATERRIRTNNNAP